MTETILSIEKAHELVVAALVASNTSANNARSVADALIAAECAGQGGHGLRRVPAYSAQARAGKVDGRAVPAIEQPLPGLLRVDAAHGFAYPALDLCHDNLPAMARACGIAAGGIFRSHHAGVAGVQVERYARMGLVALMFANAPASMAPWGARRPLFGTDPIAFAAPVPAGDPIVVDVSLSRVARGKLMAAAQKGDAIPEGWALDPDGNPTTDPKAGMAGTMVPMGEVKGTALALMVELLAAGLTGGNYAYEASSFFDDRGPPPDTGQLIMVIDPQGFGPGAIDRFGDMAAMVEGSDGARLPGSRRHETRRRVEAGGIAVDDKLLDEIHALYR